jgi:hypothetical protein
MSRPVRLAGEGMDPEAINTSHTGDVVGYGGHVTVSDEDIRRVRGRKGYGSNCAEVQP